jgi:hypothetical protein
MAIIITERGLLLDDDLEKLEREIAAFQKTHDRNGKSLRTRPTDRERREANRKFKRDVAFDLAYDHDTGCHDFDDMIDVLTERE